MDLTYFYRAELLSTSEGLALHTRVCALIDQLHISKRIQGRAVRDVETMDADSDERGRLLGELREFSVRHKVGLARVFGSRRFGFAYMPPQFLLVRDRGALREVFPCRISGSEIEPVEYLEQMACGKAWTRRSGAGMEGTHHKLLVQQIVANSDSLEPGLVLCGANVMVSQDFGEQGFIDLFFEDARSQPLLVEVKCDTDELDKAVGQILRHRYFFAQQNQIGQDRIRVAVCCPRIPAYYRSICHDCGIECFEFNQEA
jgi:hypothetical protein